MSKPPVMGDKPDPQNDAADPRTARIRELNDAFRRTFVGGYVIITRRLARLGRDHIGEILLKIASHQEFPDDPQGDHDMGVFTAAGQEIIWKIDYFGERLAGASADPADPQKTWRVLTVMLADEY
jgi:hypothetical protein